MENFVYTKGGKGRIVRTVSLTHEDDALITELNISLSGILRAKINEIREASANYQALMEEKDKTIQKQQRAIETLQAELLKRSENNV